MADDRTPAEIAERDQDPVDVCQRTLMLADRRDAETLVRDGWNPSDG